MSTGRGAERSSRGKPGSGQGQGQGLRERGAGRGPERGQESVLEIDSLLDDPETRIVVCCGSGGVGKTTTAAALGLRAAERGRKVVVLTIDPARRLAQSMGLSELDNSPRRVPGVAEDKGGELHAMMLDMKRTFDEVVEAHADEERARAILENPFYASLSAGFAGTQEYMAMEKLGQLRARDEWDLIVVDTPPSRSALDFLDAPKRLGSFLDGRFIRLLTAPAKVGGRAGMKFVNLGVAGLSMFTGALDKLLGASLLRDVQTFVAAMDTTFGGFRTRADATYRLLQGSDTAFLVVAAPERDALREAAYFVARLEAERMPLAGLVLNKMHSSGASELSAERALAAAENLEDPGIVDRRPGKTDERGGAAARPAAEAPADGSPEASPDRGDQSEAASASPDPRSGRVPETGRGGPEPDRDIGTGPGFEARSGADPDSGSGSGSEPSSGAGGSTGGGGSPPGSGSRSGSLGSDPVSRSGLGSGSGSGADSAAGPRPDATDVALAAGLLRLHAERMRVLARERRTRDGFVARHPEVPVAEVAALPGDVHDLAGLRAVGARLADQPGTGRRRPDRGDSDRGDPYRGDADRSGGAGA